MKWAGCAPSHASPSLSLAVSGCGQCWQGALTPRVVVVAWALVAAPALLLACSVALGQPLSLSGSPFPLLENGPAMGLCLVPGVISSWESGLGEQCPHWPGASAGHLLCWTGPRHLTWLL